LRRRKPHLRGRETRPHGPLCARKRESAVDRPRRRPRCFPGRGRSPRGGARREASSTGVEPGSRATTRGRASTPALAENCTRSPRSACAIPTSVDPRPTGSPPWSRRSPDPRLYTLAGSRTPKN